MSGEISADTGIIDAKKISNHFFYLYFPTKYILNIFRDETTLNVLWNFTRNAFNVENLL